MYSPALTAAIGEIVGSDNILTDKESLLCYSYDATRYNAMPDAVVKPRTADEVATRQ